MTPCPLRGGCNSRVASALKTVNSLAPLCSLEYEHVNREVKVDRQRLPARRSPPRRYRLDGHGGDHSALSSWPRRHRAPAWHHLWRWRYSWNSGQQSGSLVGASVVDQRISMVFEGFDAQVGSCRRAGTPSLLTSPTSSLDRPGSCMEAFSLKVDSLNPSGFGPPSAYGRRSLG